MYTRIPYQRNQFVLMQIGVDTNQENVMLRNVIISLLQIVKPKSGGIIRVNSPETATGNECAGAKSVSRLVEETRTRSEKICTSEVVLGQADWFFDQEGIGLHYRTHEIVKDGTQLDIYLTKAQTQQVLKADVYTQLF